MPPVQYRRADRSDVPAMARIRAEGGWEGGAPEERMARYLDGQHHPQHALPPRVMYVALEAEALVGFIAGHLTRRYECDGELQWIYVIPARRGSGVAAALLRLLAKSFTDQDASRICVNVDPANAAARRFYMRHGAVPLNDYWLVWNEIKVALKEALR